MKTVKFLQKNWQKATVATGLVLASSYANAADPISTLLDGIDISSAAAKIAAFGIAVVGIALGIHGITVAKRVINKM